MGFSRQEYWSGLPFPSPVDHILSDFSTMTCLSWVAPQAWLSFIELDKAVVLVWLDWLVFCEYAFSVFALWCPLVTPMVLLGFLLPWMWGISSQLLQQSPALLLTLDEGYLLIAAPADLERGVAPLSRPFCIRAAAASMIKEMQIKITVLLYSYHLAKLESWIISTGGGDVEKLSFSCTLGDSVKLCCYSSI